jgi:predicted aspartyl protease
MRAGGLLALWLAVFLSVPRAAPIEQEAVTRFEHVDHDIVLAVRLNGRGPFRLLLDTGSTHTAVSARTAADIGAPVVARTSTGSAAGSQDTLVVRIDSLEVGPIGHRELLASIVELDHIAGEGGLDGVIGQDALASLRYTIDFRQRRIVWWPGEPGVRGVSVELQWNLGRFVMSLPQPQSVLRLVPDTGAASLLLFTPDRGLPVTELPTPATLTTMSGAREVRLARVRELHVGSLRLRDLPAVLAERDDSEPAGIDGLLPLQLFDRVTVDGPRKRMIVEKTRADHRLMFF